MRNVLNFFKRLSRPSRSSSVPASRAAVDSAGLDFLNSLSAILEIELTEPAQPIAPGLRNLAASPASKLSQLRLAVEVFDPESDTGRPLTKDEGERIVFVVPAIQLRSDSGIVISHNAPDGVQFTVASLLAAVEDTERRTRADTVWLGGIDVHHIYFEGLHATDDGIWEIGWGS